MLDQEQKKVKIVIECTIRERALIKTLAASKNLTISECVLSVFQTEFDSIQNLYQKIKPDYIC